MERIGRRRGATNSRLRWRVVERDDDGAVSTTRYFTSLNQMSEHYGVSKHALSRLHLRGERASPSAPHLAAWRRRRIERHPRGDFCADGVAGAPFIEHLVRLPMHSAKEALLRRNRGAPGECLVCTRDAGAASLVNLLWSNSTDVDVICRRCLAVQLEMPLTMWNQPERPEAVERVRPMLAGTT